MALAFELPAEVAGLISLDEVVIHGWDVARASGQPFAAEPAHLEALVHLLTEVPGPGEGLLRDAVFGPVVEVPDDALPLDRVVGLTGRDPGWTPG